MIHLTDTAVAAIKTAIARASETVAADARAAEGLRIMVQTGGCAGFKYMMGLEAEARDGDALVLQDGVKLFIDSEFAAAHGRHDRRLRQRARKLRLRVRKPQRIVEMLVRQVVLVTPEPKRRRTHV